MDSSRPWKYLFVVKTSAYIIDDQVILHSISISWLRSTSQRGNVVLGSLCWQQTQETSKKRLSIRSLNTTYGSADTFQHSNQHKATLKKDNMG